MFTNHGSSASDILSEKASYCVRPAPVKARRAELSLLSLFPCPEKNSADSTVAHAVWAKMTSFGADATALIEHRPVARDRIETGHESVSEANCR
jgi:hypothetical protein